MTSIADELGIPSTTFINGQKLTAKKVTLAFQAKGTQKHQKKN